MKKLGHLLRAALLGFLALFTVAGLVIATEIEKHRPASVDAPSNGANAAHADGPDAGPDAERPPPGRGVLGNMIGLGLFGALVAIAQALLLLLFPVGPASKVVYGLVCGPAVPMLLWAPPMLRRGNAEDAGAIVVLGMLVGLLVGVLDANRVARARREGGGARLEA